jgi:V-type H+-transporting ATPase subunit a
MVDTYGIPTYKEANPLLVSLVTFPILFGMMFGDIGHGTLLFAAGAYLVWTHDTKNPGIFGVMRYFLFTNGLAALYCGIIYNEFFSMKLNLFKSCYDVTQTEPWYNSKYVFDAGPMSNAPVDRSKYPNAVDYLYPKKEEVQYVYMRKNEDCVYPFGFDPAWGISSNDLTTSNGIKMKLSVIFAIFHMTIGILIKGTNLIYKRHWAHFFAEVITGLVILLGLFGWMDYLIFVKWFFPINIDSTTRIPFFGGKIDKQCVSGDKWPLGKYEVDGAGNKIYTSWEPAK